MLKNMNKTTKNNMITYLMVIVVYAVIQVLVTSGSLSSLFTGLLVPICTYIILAISLNLVVGFLGELSLGHAGFMCIGAFTSAFFSKCMKGVIEPDLFKIHDCSSDRSSVRRNFRNPNWNSGTSSEWRLPGNCNTGVWRDY